MMIHLIRINGFLSIAWSKYSDTADHGPSSPSVQLGSAQTTVLSMHNGQVVLSADILRLPRTPNTCYDMVTKECTGTMQVPTNDESRRKPPRAHSFFS